MSKHFSSGDDKAFQTLVSKLLTLEAHAKRGMDEAEYVALAREVWSSCEKDSVYAIKLLFDPIVQPQFREESESDLFCVLVARIGPGGELIDAPLDYNPPNYPGVRLSHVVAGSPSGGAEPDTSQVQTYLLAYFDVLGFEDLLTKVGLAEVQKRYLSLLDQTLRPQSQERQWSRAKSIIQNHVVPAMMWLPMHAAHFSDSLLLWVHYHPGHVEEFLNRCARVFCKALDLGVPLRGAITVGDSVLDRASNIFLGEPLVEAARLESKQDWVGVALGSSFKNESLHIPIPPSNIRIYTPPLKNGGAEIFGDLVLDWPRTWWNEYSASAIDKLNALSGSELPVHIQARYLAAVEFYEASYADRDWDVPEGFIRA